MKPKKAEFDIEILIWQIEISAQEGYACNFMFDRHYDVHVYRLLGTAVTNCIKDTLVTE